MPNNKNREINTIYSATGNTIVVAQLNITNNGGRSTVKIIRLDENDNEYQMAAGSAHYYTNSDMHIKSSTITAPFKDGERYKIINTETFPSSEVHAYFVEF